jgi:hypothetical protein
MEEWAMSEDAEHQVLGSLGVRARIEASGWRIDPAFTAPEESTAEPLALPSESSAGVGDYLLCAEGRILAAVETKTAVVDTQATFGRLRALSDRYRPEDGVDAGVPFLYVSDGITIQFLDARTKRNQPRRVAGFHTPSGLRDLIGRDVDAELHALATIGASRLLRPHQLAVGQAIDAAIVVGQRRMIVRMATGTGKTTAFINEIHRLMKAGVARRVLYLVDRRNIAAQVCHAFSTFEVETGQSFSKVFPVYGDLHLSAERSSAELHSGSPAAFVAVATVQRLAAHMREHRRDTPIDAYDLIVVDDAHLTAGPSGPSVWQRTLAHFDAITIMVTSGPAVASADDWGPVVFQYETEQAIRDGTLVGYPEAKVRSRAAAWPEFDPDDRTFAQRRVFLSYAEEDVADARSIAQRLTGYGIGVWFSEWDAAAGQDLTQQILTQIGSREIFVLLLSPASVASTWVRDELDRALQRRGIELVPTLIKPCPIPATLADHGLVDATNDIDGLLRRLQVGARLDWNTLDARQFKQLVSELLRRLNFDFPEAQSRPDGDYDLSGRYQDPHGFADAVPYLVQIRFAKHGASSVRRLHHLAGAVTSRGPGVRGLLVTNSQLTSVAAKTLEEVNSGGVKVRVIDGPELRMLLLSQPDVITEFFPADKGSDAER